jgi:hypothetical protein
MAKTIRKGVNMRSTRSKKQIRGGMKTNALLLLILLCVSITDIIAHRATDPTTPEVIERRNNNLKQAFTDKLGVPVIRTTRYSVYIDASDVTKLQGFLKEQGLDKQIGVDPSTGEVKPTRMSLNRNIVALINILRME